MNRPLPIVAVIALMIVASITGCDIPSFSHSLVDPDQAVVPKELMGSYFELELESKNPDQAANEFDVFDEFAPDESEESSAIRFVHIGIAGDNYPPGFIRILFVSAPGDSPGTIKSSSIVGFTQKMGDQWVLHVPVPQSGLGSPGPSDDQEKWDPEKIENYLMVFLTPTAAGFDEQFLNSDLFIHAIKTKQLDGTYHPRHASIPAKRDPPAEEEAKPKFSVTADRESLLAFFKKHLADHQLLEEPSRSYLRIQPPKR